MPESKETQELFWTFEELEDCNYSRHNCKLDEPKEVLQFWASCPLRSQLTLALHSSDKYPTYKPGPCQILPQYPVVYLQFLLPPPSLQLKMPQETGSK